MFYLPRTATDFFKEKPEGADHLIEKSPRNLFVVYQLVLPSLDIIRGNRYQRFIQLPQELPQDRDVGANGLCCVAANDQRFAHGLKFVLHGIPPP